MQDQASFSASWSLEGAGIVGKCGQNATIAEGTLVTLRDKSIWAEYVVVPAEKATIPPPDSPVEKALPVLSESGCRNGVALLSK